MESRSGILVAGLALVMAMGIGGCSGGEKKAADQPAQGVANPAAGTAAPGAPPAEPKPE